MSKIVLTFRKAKFNYDNYGGYNTKADSAFYLAASEYTKTGKVTVRIKHLAQADDFRKCKIIFEGPGAQQAVYAFIELFGRTITRIKMR